MEKAKTSTNIDYVVNPTVEILAKFLYNIDVITQKELSTQGLLRFVYSKNSDVIFANALKYYHLDLRQILNSPENNLEGFLNGDHLLQIRLETAENYLKKNNPTKEDILETTFYKTFCDIVKNIEFLT